MLKGSQKILSKRWNLFENNPTNDTQSPALFLSTNNPLTHIAQHPRIDFQKKHNPT